MHGVRICPDLDTCMYTLGGGIDPERGWGHRNETWHAKEELAAVRRAARLVRTRRPRPGDPSGAQPDAARRLSAVAGDRGAVRPVAARRAAAARQRRPLRNTRRHHRSRPTTVGARSTSRSGGSATARSCRRTASPSSAPKRPMPTTEVTEAIAEADVVLVAPSNPVVSVGAILAVPGIRGGAAVHRRPGRRLLADHRWKAVARHGR